MRIQHNILAMNAYRNYTSNVGALGKNLEKLSSGYKINRAGDDAAGLAISEKMRAQITGLDAAQKNVKDGISLVKTAEGAMQEVQDMLNRMDYLATQSANGTYDNEVDRANLQKEVSALKDEINRIADSANFNGIKLLDGSLAKVDAVAGGTNSEAIEVSGADRIIQDVAGKGDKDWEVAGTKTVLDSVPGDAPQVGKFQIDFNTMDFKVQGKASGGDASAATGTITVKIGNTTITSATGTSGVDGIKMSSAGSTVSADDIAESVLNGIKKAAASKGLASDGSAVIEINNVKWTVTNTSGVLEFTQQAIPKTQDEAKTNFDVSISYSAASGASSTGNNKFEITIPGATSSTSGDTTSTATGTVTPVWSIKVGTYTSQPGIAQEDSHKANTVFNIKAEDIKDGTKIAIGTKSLILQLGSDSETSVDKASSSSTTDKDGNTIVKLSKDADLNTALAKISNTITSTVNLKILGTDGAVKNVTFQIGVSDGSQGFPTGLTLVRQKEVGNNNGDSGYNLAFDSLDKLAVNFKMEVSGSSTTEAVEAKNGLTLQIGDTSDPFNQMSVVIGDMHTTGMGIDGVDIGTQEGAAAAIQTIRDAINYVSGIRGDLGAVQNRLEHTQNNLSVMAENIQDAESTIRDTDVAAEMMSYVKNNILVQSAQAMLAQANQVPQGVLQLLG